MIIISHRHGRALSKTVILVSRYEYVPNGISRQSLLSKDYQLYRLFTVQLFSQILVHDPYSFPLVIGRGMSVGIGQEAFVSVNAQSRMRLVANNRTPSYGSIFLTTCTIHKII